MEFYTITEMARILKIPESTARFYRDRHQDYLHHTGKGRNKRYTKEALEALRYICELSNNSRNADEIDRQLQARFNSQIDVTEITAVTTAGEQQLKLMEALTTNLRDIADQKKEIQGLRNEIKELREIVTTPLIKRLFRKNKNV